MAIDTASPEFSLDACNCLALRRAARRVSQAYDATLAEAGLNAAQFAVLAALGKGGPAPVNVLARRLELDRTTMGKNLRPLENAGLLAVTRAPGDGRSRLIALTGEGRATLARAGGLWRQAQIAFETLNGAETAAALRATLAGLKTKPATQEAAR